MHKCRLYAFNFKKHYQIYTLQLNGIVSSFISSALLLITHMKQSQDFSNWNIVILGELHMWIGKVPHTCSNITVCSCCLNTSKM